MKRAAKGFTIIELLIVIVIIAVLASITLIAYSTLSSRAQASAAQSDAKSLAKLLALANVSNGSYPSDLTTINNGGPMPSNDGTTYVYHQQNGGANYCVTVTNGTSSYVITDQATSPTAGGCPGDGQGGQSAITNLMTNPSFETNTTGASPISGATITRTAMTTPAGSYALQVATSSSAASGVVVSSGPISSFGTYTASAYLWGSGTIGLWMRFNYSDSTATDETGYPITTLNGTPQRVNATFTFPNNGKTPTSIYIMARTSSSQTTTFYVDGLMLTSGGTNYNYADGNSPNWIWNGSVNNSTSTGPPQ